MSGILDKKQRLVDFILTADGYRQVENGDLRFVYATLTDKDAIYDRRQNEYNVADLDAMSFNFEASSNFFDKLNSEIDLKQTANFELRTEIDGQYIDLRNNEYQNTLTKPASLIFDKISGSFAENLVNQQIILTDNFFNLNLETGENNPISLYVSKINKDKINLNSEINLENQSCSIQLNSLTDYNTLCNSNSLNLSKTSMIEDDRFKNKLNYLFLPPTNMNTEVITRNNKISNSYNLAEDKRDLHKIIFKNFKSNGDVAVELLRNFKDLQTNNVNDVILESIKILIDNNIDLDQITPEPALVLATKYNMIDIVKIILDNKCNIDITDIFGKSALGWAIYNNNFDLIKLLVNKGANINLYTHLGETFLPILAINYGTNEIINFLLDHDINYEFTDYNRNTISHLIAKYANEYPSKIVRKIIENTKDLNKQNVDGDSIALLLWEHHTMLEYLFDTLIDKRIDIFITNNKNQNIFTNFIIGKQRALTTEIIFKGLEKQLKNPKYIKPKFTDLNDLVFNQKISYLQTKEEQDELELENSIQIKDYPYYNYSLFKNYYFDDIMMFIIIWIRHKEEITIPIINKDELVYLDKYIDTKAIGFKRKMINDHYIFMKHYFLEFLPIEIVWHDKDNYVFTEFHEIAFMNAIERSQRFVVIMLGFFLGETSNGHANILIYDKKKKLLERFDPEGIINLENLKNMDKFLRDKFMKLINDKEFKYITPYEHKLVNSFQKLSDEANEYKRKTGDVRGFCQAWVFWYLEMRLLNKEINPIKLVNKLLNRLLKMNISLLEYIRNYANILRNDVEKLMIETGINEKNLNSEKYTENIYINVSNKMVSIVSNELL
jgi:ankyrin repeat protein